MREILFILLGGVIMFFVLTFIAGKKKKTDTKTSDTLLKELLTTSESINLLKTNEFKTLSDTTEFRNYVKLLTQEQIYALANKLTE